MDNKITIGERTFSIGTLPARKAVFVEVAVARVIGEPLFKAITEERPDDGGDTGVGAVVVGLLLKNLDSEELSKVMDIVFEHVSVNGARIVDIDATFTGSPRDLWQVFIFALRWNFRDFLPESLFDSIRKKIMV